MGLDYTAQARSIEIGTQVSDIAPETSGQLGVGIETLAGQMVVRRLQRLQVGDGTGHCGGERGQVVSKSSLFVRERGDGETGFTDGMSHGQVAFVIGRFLVNRLRGRGHRRRPSH